MFAESCLIRNTGIEAIDIRSTFINLCVHSLLLSPCTGMELSDEGVTIYIYIYIYII